MAHKTSYIEVNGKIVEIEDMELFKSVGSLAAYNEALGNRVETNIWGKLFAWNQARAKQTQEEVEETEQWEYRLSGKEPPSDPASEPAEQYDEVKEVWDKCRDVDGTAILGWWQ